MIDIGMVRLFIVSLLVVHLNVYTVDKFCIIQSTMRFLEFLQVVNSRNC